MLEDHVVTDEEYESALTRAARCVDARGFRTGPIETFPDGIRRGFAVDAAPDDADEAARAFQTCVWESSAAVESVYLAQHSIAADALPRLRTEYMGCLRDAGIEGIRTDMTDAVIAQNLERQGGGIEAWTCREKYLILSGDVGARPMGD